MDTYELYLVTNKVNNKKYVGQTKSKIGYQKRWADHCAEAMRIKTNQCIFHSAIKVYGVDSFTVKRILKDIPEQDIDRLETIWIEKLNTFYTDGFGYNMTRGGQGVHGFVHTPESKEKIRKSLKSNPSYWTPELIQRMEDKKRASGYYEKRRKNPLWRAKLSQSMKVFYKSHPNPFQGKKHTDESKHRMSLSRGKPVLMCDKNTSEILKMFENAMLAGKFVSSLGNTSNKTPNGRILDVCHGDAITAYGYKWKFMDSVTTNPDECKDVGEKTSYSSKDETT